MGEASRGDRRRLPRRPRDERPRIPIGPGRPSRLAGSRERGLLPLGLDLQGPLHRGDLQLRQRGLPGHEVPAQERDRDHVPGRIRRGDRSGHLQRLSGVPAPLSFRGPGLRPRAEKGLRRRRPLFRVRHLPLGLRPKGDHSGGPGLGPGGGSSGSESRAFGDVRAWRRAIGL